MKRHFLFAALVLCSLPVILSLALINRAGASEPEPEAVFFGDMAIEKNSVTATDSTRGTLAAARLDVEFWEDGVLPFRFDKGISRDEKKILFSACSKWSQVARVRCIDGKYRGRSIGVTKIPGGCWSFLGMGRQFGVLRRHMNLEKGCWREDIILHELGHALGLIHEHQRPDRDDFVTIHPENIGAGFLGLQVKVNFARQGSEKKSPYDFLSIMHYDRKAFSKNGKDTITPKAPYTRYLDTMGNVTSLSASDAELVASIYGRP